MNHPYSYIHSGIRFPLEPDRINASHIRYGDIIHHLSQIPRWNGGTREPFSVLEHSIYCNLLVQEFIAEQDLDLRLLMLFHDAHESVTGDIPTTLKELCPAIQKLQDAYDKVLFKRLGLWPLTPEMRGWVARIDMLAKVGEAKAFLPENVWTEIVKPDKVYPIPETSPKACSWGERRQQARNAFLNTLEQIQDARKLVVTED